MTVLPGLADVAPTASFSLPARVLLSAGVPLGNTDVLKYSRADCTSLQDYVKVMGFNLKSGPPTSSVILIKFT